MSFSFYSKKSFLNQEFTTFPSFHFHCSGFFLCAMILSSDCNQYCCNRQHMYFIISQKMVRDYRAFILPVPKIHPSTSSSCPLQAVPFFPSIDNGICITPKVFNINLLKNSVKYSFLNEICCCKTYYWEVFLCLITAKSCVPLLTNKLIIKKLNHRQSGVQSADQHGKKKIFF